MANQREKAESSEDDSPKSVVNNEEIKIQIPDDKPPSTPPVKIDVSKIKFKTDAPSATPKIKLIKPSQGLKINSKNITISSS